MVNRIWKFITKRVRKQAMHENTLLYKVGDIINHDNQCYEVVATVFDHMQLQEKHKAWKYRLVKHLGGGHTKVYIFKDNDAIRDWLASKVQLNDYEIIIKGKSTDKAA